MNNFYKNGYLDCIRAILKEAEEHKDEISYDTLKERLVDLFLVKEVEFDDWIDDVEGMSEDEILAKMKEDE